MAVGGDLIEATYNHPNLGTGSFFFKAAEDGDFLLGGFSSEDEANGIDGAGNMIDVITQKRWSIEATISWDMNNNNELKVLQDLSADPILSDWTFSHVNGTVWIGKGKPVGDITGSSKATTKIKISGSGKLSKL